MSRGKAILDSGAHTLYTEEVLKKGNKLAFGRPDKGTGFGYYETDAFWDYVDKYGEFIKEYGQGLDAFVTVDVIFNPEMSWKVQKYLERVYGVVPLPVFHWGTDQKWLKRYLKDGHQYIGIGGLGQEVSTANYVDWADRLFSYLQGSQSEVRTHGFAMTSFFLLRRYSWTSVDSTTWVVLAGYGKLLIPHLRMNYAKGREEFDFSVFPYILTSSNNEGKVRIKKGLGYYSLSGLENRTVGMWFEKIGLVLGDDNEEGVRNKHKQRCIANLRYFLELEKWLKTQERKVTPRERFGLV
jgi:hypothetical protein